MKQKISQILYDMRHQPLVAWVSLVATALSIFLIMIVVMMQQVKVEPYAPESCRDRLLVGMYLHMESNNGGNESMSAGLGMKTARFLYENLDSVEHVSFLETSTTKSDVKGTTGTSFTVRSRRVDSEFFNIFDHPLLAGRYFTREESDALVPVVVIAEKVARRAFGSIDCVGSTLSVQRKNYTVVGVVNDNTPLALTGSGDLFIASGADDPAMNPDWGGPEGSFGPVGAALLVKEGVDLQAVRDQVIARYSMYDSKIADNNLRTVYHGAPFDKEDLASGVAGSNKTPDTESSRNMRIVTYAILLIVPAINLSTMLHSRMRRRVSEIGVRRAFGCTRARVITDILTENFIITIAGGIVGLALGMIFALTYSGLYEDMATYGTDLTPAFSAVFNWSTIITAVGMCFILNLISASVPAWQASRMSPVDAINAR